MCLPSLEQVVTEESLVRLLFLNFFFNKAGGKWLLPGSGDLNADR